MRVPARKTMVVARARRRPRRTSALTAGLRTTAKKVAITIRTITLRSAMSSSIDAAAARTTPMVARMRRHGTGGGSVRPEGEASDRGRPLLDRAAGEAGQLAPSLAGSAFMASLLRHPPACQAIPGERVDRRKHLRWVRICAADNRSPGSPARSRLAPGSRLGWEAAFPLCHDGWGGAVAR